MNHIIDSIFHWINWSGVAETALVIWAAALLLFELYLLERHLERKIRDSMKC